MTRLQFTSTRSKLILTATGLVLIFSILLGYFVDKPLGNDPMIVAGAIEDVLNWTKKPRETSTILPRATKFKSPWVFEKNKGQAPKPYSYVLRSPYFSAGFSENKFALNLPRHNIESATNKRESRGRRKGNSLLFEFLDANNSKILGLQRVRQTVNSYIGNNRDHWVKDILTYERLVQTGLYDGINFSITAPAGRLAYSFLVEPKHSSKMIRISVKGSRSLSIDASGNLVIKTTEGTVLQSKPRFFEVTKTNRRELEGSYELLGDNEFGFKVNGRDKNKALLIDPEIVFATYFGGNLNDAMLGGDTGAMDFIGRGYDIQAGPDGDVHIIGRTTSLDFPLTGGSGLNGASSDMFVLRIDPDGPIGARLKYSVFVGGTSIENGRSIAVLEDSSVYITGWSGSADFPVSPGVVQATRVSSGGVIAKLSPDGQFLLGSFVGNARSNHPNSIVFDKRDSEASGFIYLGGSSAGFGGSDATTGSLQNTYSGGQYDGFIAKFNLDLSQYEYFTYLGGTGRDVIYDIDVNDGWVFASGTTASFDLPAGLLGVEPHVHSESGNPNCNGTFGSRECADAFVARLDRSGSALLYLNYYGSGMEEYARGIAASEDNEAYFTGARRTPGTNSSIIFLTKITASGESVDWEQTWNGIGTDHGEEISIDPIGRAHIVGTSSVPGHLIGLRNDNDYLGTSDMFYARVKAGNDTTPTPGVPSPGEVEYFAYLGGAADDRGFAIDGWGDTTGNYCVSLAGATVSQDVSVIMPLDGGSTNSGVSDLLLYQLCDVSGDGVGVIKMGPDSVSPGDSIEYTITLGNSGDQNVQVTVSDVVPSSVSVTGVSGCTRTGNNVSCAVDVGFVPDTITITGDVASNICPAGGQIVNEVTISGEVDGVPFTSSAVHTSDIVCPSTPAECLNGVVEGAEQCEPGVPPFSTTCRNNCTVMYCGDNIVDDTPSYTEQCEPPGGSRCDQNCMDIAPFCGDGIRDPGPPRFEQCDNDTQYCDSDCNRVYICGDGILEGPEECDDGPLSTDPNCDDCKVVAACGEYCREVGGVNGREYCGNVCPVCQRSYFAGDPGSQWKVCWLFIVPFPCKVENDVLQPLYGRCVPPGSPEIIYEY